MRSYLPLTLLTLLACSAPETADDAGHAFAAPGRPSSNGGFEADADNAAPSAGTDDALRNAAGRRAAAEHRRPAAPGRRLRVDLRPRGRDREQPDPQLTRRPPSAIRATARAPWSSRARRRTNVNSLSKSTTVDADDVDPETAASTCASSSRPVMNASSHPPRARPYFYRGAHGSSRGDELELDVVARPRAARVARPRHTGLQSL